MSYANLLLNILYHIVIEMNIRESCLQTGTFIYKPGISVTKQDFHLQTGIIGLQMGFSGYYLPIFPECSLTGYPPRNISNASCVDFNLVQIMCDKLQSIANKNDISFIIGTIFKEKEIYNRAMLFQPNSQIEFYDKRALWGWDKDNFTKGSNNGIFEMEGIKFGIRICFEIRFPEFFRELYKRNTDINLVLFYDVADIDDNERYNMIKGHLQTRAVENVTTTISVNAISPFQTAPTMVLGKSGQCIKECVRNKPELLIYDFEKTENDFGENGRISISDMLIE